MTPVELVIERLDAAGCRPRGHSKTTARCPAHDDRNPSLSVAEGRDGAALIYCHAGCALADIIAALGLELRDLFPNRASFRARRPSGLGRDLRLVSILGEVKPAPAKSCDGVDVPELPPLHAAVLRVLHDHAFFAPVCCPSQELIAAEVGCARETVNRVCHELRDLGLIDWTHKLRSGSRWFHNVYRLLSHWHRPHRQAVIARIRAARDRLRGRLWSQDHTKRTARDVEGNRWGVGDAQGARSGSEKVFGSAKVAAFTSRSGSEAAQPSGMGGRVARGVV